MRRTIIVAVVSGLVGALVATPIVVYASHGFSDVPASNTFHADIEWLRQSGVTRGCNPPANTQFCPDDPVTREQMSAFMRRFAQYMGAEDGTPAQADHASTANSANNANSAATADEADHANTANSANNASMLQGNTVAELAPRAAFNAVDEAEAGQNLILPVQITAPAPGMLILSGTVDAFNLTDSDNPSCRLRVNGENVSGTFMVTGLDADGNVNESENCSTTGAVAVDAGNHTVDLEVVVGVATTGLGDASVWAMWVPFDGTGSVPTTFTQLGDPDDLDDLIEEQPDN